MSKTFKKVRRKPNGFGRGLILKKSQGKFEFVPTTSARRRRAVA